MDSWDRAELLLSLIFPSTWNNLSLIYILWIHKKYTTALSELTQGTYKSYICVILQIWYIYSSIKLGIRLVYFQKKKNNQTDTKTYFNSKSCECESWNISVKHQSVSWKTLENCLEPLNLSFPLMLICFNWNKSQTPSCNGSPWRWRRSKRLFLSPMHCNQKLQWHIKKYWHL